MEQGFTAVVTLDQGARRFPWAEAGYPSTRRQTLVRLVNRGFDPFRVDLDVQENLAFGDALDSDLQGALRSYKYITRSDDQVCHRNPRQVFRGRVSWG